MKLLLFAFYSCLIIGFINGASLGSDSENDEVASDSDNGSENGNDTDESEEFFNEFSDMSDTEDFEPEPATSAENTGNDHISESDPANIVAPNESEGNDNLGDEDLQELGENGQWQNEIVVEELNYTYFLEFIEIVNKTTNYNILNLTDIKRFEEEESEEMIRPEDRFLPGFEEEMMRREMRHRARFEEQMRRREHRHFGGFEEEMMRRDHRSFPGFEDDEFGRPGQRHLSKFEEQFLRPENDTSDDLQIFFIGGRYTCVSYNGTTETLNVYDKQEVVDRLRSLLNIRYPKAKVINTVKLNDKPPQNEKTSGIFAIAYATSLIFEQDPSLLLYHIDEEKANKTESLREHFDKILAEKRLEVFPSEVYDEVWQDIRKGWLAADFLWEFMQIVMNESDYKMIDPYLYGLHEYYVRPKNESHLDDIQILWGNDHYAAVFYNASEETVYILDKNEYLCKGILTLIDVRYPYSRVMYAFPETPQPDTVSCGIMSAAYVTMIVMGEDPRRVPLKLDEGKKNKTVTLRAHFRKILREKRLEKFPMP